MDHLIGRIKQFSQRRYEEDVVDRLNFQVSPIILIVASSLITYKAYFGNQDALACWTPQQFRKGWDQYVNDFCLVENTYFVPTNSNTLPTSILEREDRKLPYYQWVPFVLALQAMLFCIPHMFWRAFNWFSGIQVRAVVGMTTRTLKFTQISYDPTVVELIANHIYAALRMNKIIGKNQMITNPIGFCFGFLTRSTACFVTCCYLVMKGLFLANLFLQIAILNFFLDIRDGSSLIWGIRLLIQLITGSEWRQTAIFPRVTVCDFEIRELGNLHRWTVQCVLPLNMFNEKLFILLWCWIHFLLVVTIINIINWMINLLSLRQRINYYKTLLDIIQTEHEDVIADSKKSGDKDLAIQLNDKLGWDGILLLRIIKDNTSDFACADIISHIIRKMTKERRKQKPSWIQKSSFSSPTAPKLIME